MPAPVQKAMAKKAEVAVVKAVKKAGRARVAAGAAKHKRSKSGALNPFESPKKGGWPWFLAHWRQIQRKLVFKGELNNTSGGMKGLLKEDFLLNKKKKKVVSKKLSKHGRALAWPQAVKAARRHLGLVGFVPIVKDTDFYNVIVTFCTMIKNGHPLEPPEPEPECEVEPIPDEPEPAPENM